MINKLTIAPTVLALLRTVKKTAGYHTDLGNNVHDLLEYVADESTTLKASVSLQSNYDTSNGFSEYITIEVRILCQDGDNTPSTLRKASADVFACIYDNRATLTGDGILDIKPEGAEEDGEYTDKKRATATIRFTMITMKTKWTA